MAKHPDNAYVIVAAVTAALLMVNILTQKQTITGSELVSAYDTVSGERKIMLVTGPESEAPLLP